MGKLIQFQHPGNYRLIDVDGQLYRFPKDQEIPFEAALMQDDIMDMPGLWAHPRYNERAKKDIAELSKRLLREVNKEIKRRKDTKKGGHDNP